jgi:hypothetical protein
MYFCKLTNFSPFFLYICQEMKVIVAPDSYKGCLPAGEVAAIVADSLRKAHPDWEVLE